MQHAVTSYSPSAVISGLHLSIFSDANKVSMVEI